MCRPFVFAQMCANVSTDEAAEAAAAPVPTTGPAAERVERGGRLGPARRPDGSVYIGPPATAVNVGIPQGVDRGASAIDPDGQLWSIGYGAQGEYQPHAE
jgi:hypothetical protein